MPDDDGHVRAQARRPDRRHGRPGRRRNGHRAACPKARPRCSSDQRPHEAAGAAGKGPRHARDDPLSHADDRRARQLLPRAADGTHPRASASPGRRRDRRPLVRQGFQDRTSPSGSRRPAIGSSPSKPSTATTRSSSRRSGRRDGTHPHPGRRSGRDADRQPPVPQAPHADRTRRVERGGGRRDAAPTSTSPASCTSPWAASGPRSSTSASAHCSTTASGCSSGRSIRVDEEAKTVVIADGTALPYDYLVLATGARILPEAIEHFTTGGPSLLHRRCGAEPPQGARRLQGRQGRHRASPSMPYKCPPAPLEVAFLIESELRERGLRDKTEMHFASPIGRAFTIESRL